MSLTIQTCIRIVAKDAANLVNLVNRATLSKKLLAHTFFLLQATHAVGALSGGGLKVDIPRFPAQLPQLYELERLMACLVFG